MTIITKETADRLHSMIDKLSGEPSKRVTVVVNLDPREVADFLAENVRNAIARMQHDNQ